MCPTPPSETIIDHGGRVSTGILDSVQVYGGMGLGGDLGADGRPTGELVSGGNVNISGLESVG